MAPGGPRVFDTSRPLRIPKLTGSAAPDWIGEGEQISEKDLTFDELTLLPDTRGPSLAGSQHRPRDLRWRGLASFGDGDDGPSLVCPVCSVGLTCRGGGAHQAFAFGLVEVEGGGFRGGLCLTSHLRWGLDVPLGSA